jgi:formylglycine-generating enzyme required for sulfatase activity
VTGAELVLIEAGSFTMGTPDGEVLREPQEELHRVELTRDFYLGRHEVTQEQWRRVMGSNPSRFTDCGPRCPVETVSHHDIERFLDRVVELGGPRLRLPSEAEWEYACRAGSDTAFSRGPTLTTGQANFDGSTPYAGAPPGRRPASTVSVGSFAANAWGLYDMHGNVWEWTSDRHCPYEDDSRDPEPDCDSPLLVIRGGSWLYGADSARCGLRYTHRPQDDGPSLGFRLASDAGPS